MPWPVIALFIRAHALTSTKSTPIFCYHTVDKRVAEILQDNPETAFIFNYKSPKQSGYKRHNQLYIIGHHAASQDQSAEFHCQQ